MMNQWNFEEHGCLIERIVIHGRLTMREVGKLSGGDVELYVMVKKL